MLSENLKRIRKEQRYTRKELGEKIGFSAKTIRDIEVGENDNPKLLTLVALSKALKVPINKLIK